ncbi:chymotrypsin-1-like [Battus philenor]|uniref:chymotrypsin-1-like n=1 Tax=Battus philenor TaxID=42288 RepID=UPI0035CEF36E
MLILNLHVYVQIMFYKEAIRFKILIYGLVWVCYLTESEGALSRIVGGYRAPKEFGRFHASLQNLTGHHVCGSAVISRNHLLTAAHCVNRVKPRFIKVIVGTTDLDKGGKQYRVKSIHIHRRYNSTRRTNDIAIMKIRGSFDLNYVSILRLPKCRLKENDPIILSGFGANEAFGVSSREMYALNLTVFSQKTCRYAMRYSKKVVDSMFCTFTKIGEGTCHGDSGGPLVKDNAIVGLVSWGIPCAVGFPDVHTRIHSYISWIRSRIRKNKNFSKMQVETEVKVSLRK